MFEKAGELGCHVLTALLTQSIEEVAPRSSSIAIACGTATIRNRGKVTMMMHTFIGEDAEAYCRRSGPAHKVFQVAHNLIETGAKSLNLEVDIRAE